MALFFNKVIFVSQCFAMLVKRIKSLGGIPVTKNNLDAFLEIYDALTPENRARLAALLEAAAHNQSASSDSPPSGKETAS